MMNETVVVLGASDKPERYSHKALMALKAHGHTVIPIHPNLDKIEGVKVIPRLANVRGPVDTVTLYVGPAVLEPLIAEVIALRPKRIISNPGSENEKMETAARNAGIHYLEACTLVMLVTGQY
ncbi:MAG: CoA-binding protein [Fibrobacterota bacterium]